MTTIIIPRKLIEKGDLIVIPRREYEEFLTLRKIIPLLRPNRYDIRALEQGRKEIRDGRYTEWRTLKHELENLRNRPRRKTN